MTHTGSDTALICRPEVTSTQSSGVMTDLLWPKQSSNPDMSTILLLMDRTCNKNAEERQENSLTASHTWEDNIKKLQKVEEKAHMWA
jgi:hypothetical protein